MKKVTLGAVVWALAMMGCSESGMDNSVASSIGAAQQGPVIEFAEIPNLQAVVDDCSLDDCGDGIYFRTFKDPYGHKYTYSHQARVENNAFNRGYGRVWVNKDEANVTKVDFLYIRTVCVEDCDDFGNCRESRLAKRHEYGYYFTTSNVQYYKNDCDKISDEKNIGVVSTFAAVFNPGQHDEVVLQSTTYKNLGREQAMWVYRNYLYPVLLQDAGL
ncbi:hypothetical protein [Fibrobacter sp. UWB12]|uniref:hypothetical protein n=1 Tax=Fibrobacter sp. UWB12 TaxID=1896203 RepID=UPI00091043A2|nr:hypothetical protein [Fibrobacter sp. UWB12]SHK53472.1 hypothetical protein SAMN05720759_103307 [Fibrobacter sp. UWB12]